MRAKLLVLSVGIAMLGGAGIACADAVVSPGTKVAPQEKAVSQTPAGTKAAPAGQARRPLVLTETQMDKITAGRGGDGHGVGFLLGGDGRGPY